MKEAREAGSWKMSERESDVHTLIAGDNPIKCIMASMSMKDCFNSRYTVPKKLRGTYEHTLDVRGGGVREREGEGVRVKVRYGGKGI